MDLFTINPDAVYFHPIVVVCVLHSTRFSEKWIEQTSAPSHLFFSAHHQHHWSACPYHCTPFRVTSCHTADQAAKINKFN
jgi:hypothetical protein